MKETIKQQKERKKLWYSLGWIEDDSDERAKVYPEYQWICNTCKKFRFTNLCDRCGRCEWCFPCN